MPERVLVIGWDGVDWKILQPMLDRGELPNLKALIDRGAYGDCLSTIPHHSWCAWPSFMTALNPAGHAVFDILEHKPGVSRRLPITFHSIKAPTVFEDFSHAGKTSLALNIPLTFPTPEIKGKVVAGGVLPAARSYTYPTELQQELDKNAPFPVNGMSWTTFRNRPEAFLEECAEITAKRQKSFEYLMDTTDWDFATLVYVSTDRIQHCLMEYIHPEHPKYPEMSQTAVAKQAAEHLPAARRRAGAAPGADDRRRSRHVHVRSRAPGVHPLRHDGPRPRALWVPRVRARLDGVQPDQVGAGTPHRAALVRHLQVARQDLDPRVADRLVEEPRLHVGRVDR